MLEQWEQSPNLKIVPKETTYNFLVKTIEVNLQHFQMSDDIPVLISAFNLLFYFYLWRIFPNVPL